MPIEAQRRKHGFTLVELLVSITITITIISITIIISIIIIIIIIIILAALVFPAMRTIRANAETTGSMGRIRTLGMANLAYASENNGKFVSVTRTPTGDPFWHPNPKVLSFAAGDAAYQKGDTSSGEVANPSPDLLFDPVVVRAKGARWNRIQVG